MCHKVFQSTSNAFDNSEPIIQMEVFAENVSTICVGQRNSKHFADTKIKVFGNRLVTRDVWMTFGRFCCFLFEMLSHNFVCICHVVNHRYFL